MSDPTANNCRIDINHGQRTLNVPPGRALLTSLKEHGIFIPSACGGRGICKYCKVKVLDGGWRVTPADDKKLTPDELASGVRLACQCKPPGDLKIDIPAELLGIRRYRGVVERIRDLTHDIKELRIRLVEPGEIKFKPGQYVELEAPREGGEGGGGDAGGVWRAFGLSNPPENRGYAELMIRKTPGGICTAWVFTMLKEGDEVSFTGPHGQFQLNDTGAEMVWIAGGSGMAPFWSMLRDMKTRGLHRKCTFFFGAAGRRDMFLLEELRQMERDLPGFRFVPAISDPAETDWSGERGLVTEVVARHVSDGASKEAYMCGAPGMIDAAIAVLHEKGFTDDRIFFDKFA